MSHNPANTPIDMQRLSSILQTLDFSTPYQLHYFSSIDSTNRYLHDLPASAILQLCCSEQQTAGKGRMLRQWHSPYAENIYFSGRWPWPASDIHTISCLSIIAGMAVIASLSDYPIAPALQIKWPNDIFWQGTKLAGILIELRKNNPADKTTPSTWEVIIGIGINVNSQPSLDYPQDRSWCALRNILQNPTELDRTILLAQLIVTLDTHIQLFQKQGMPAFLNNWQHLDYLRDQYITVSQASKNISGWARGINIQGQLLLEDMQGHTTAIYSGEAIFKGPTSHSR